MGSLVDQRQQGRLVQAVPPARGFAVRPPAGYRHRVLLLGWTLALTSAVCYGVASALQAAGARATPTAEGMDAMLLVRVMRQGRFVIGIVLDVIGFVAQLAALRILPLFVVQAVQASNLAVTAVVAVPVLKVRLRTGEWLAVAAVCVGLLLLGVSAGAQGAHRAPSGFPQGILVAALVAGVLGWLVGRWRGRIGSVVLGTLAGIQFTVVAVAARAVETVSLGGLLRDPATYALAVAGATGFLFFTTGLQRGAVTTVTGAVVVAETILPAVIGVLVFGDGTRPGLVPLAYLGFLTAVLGALALARFGEVSPPERGAPAGTA